MIETLQLFLNDRCSCVPRLPVYRQYWSNILLFFVYRSHTEAEEACGGEEVCGTDRCHVRGAQ